MTRNLQERVSDIDGNLKRNPVTDDIVLKTNEDAIRQHIDLLLLSDEFACIGRPHVCAGLKKIINEPGTSAKIAEIRNRIRETMRHENRVSVERLTVSFDPGQKYLVIEMELKHVRSNKTFDYQSRLRRIL